MTDNDKFIGSLINERKRLVESIGLIDKMLNLYELDDINSLVQSLSINNNVKVIGHTKTEIKNMVIEYAKQSGGSFNTRDVQLYLRTKDINVAKYNLISLLKRLVRDLILIEEHTDTKRVLYKQPHF